MSNIRYPKELRERATRMVLDALEDNPKDRGAVRRIAKQLAIGDQSLKKWVDQARIDQGKKPGVTSAEAIYESAPPSISRGRSCVCDEVFRPTAAQPASSPS